MSRIIKYWPELSVRDQKTYPLRPFLYMQNYRKSKTAEAYNQRVTILSSVYDHRFDIPELGETRSAIQDAKEMKKEFMTGSAHVLPQKKRKDRETYIPSILNLADDCWRAKATVPDPGKRDKR